MKKIIIISIYLISFSNICYPQSQFSKDDYKKFIGVWSSVRDSAYVRKYGYAPNDYYISLKGDKFEFNVLTEFYKGILKGKDVLLFKGNTGAFDGDILVVISTDTLIHINTGSKWEYSVEKYFRRQK